ncbi:3'-5' exonuclease [Gleimia europaea]|nr:exonuclease domain-containing protein [Gleimia europaea]
MMRRVSGNRINLDTPHLAEPALFARDEGSANDFEGDVWRREYVVVDLETTGLGADSQMTEIGAVRLKNGEIVDTFTTLVNPQMQIPPQITALTGITDLMVADAPHPDEAIRQFLHFAQLESSILIAHNASFDCGFLTRAATAANVEWPCPSVVDTLALARALLPRPLVSNHRLGTLMRHFKISNDCAHRALADATATAQVFAGLVAELRKLGGTDFADLKELPCFDNISRSRTDRL